MPHQLSGGQQQRVALARALVLEPALLLLDEPLGALDAKLRRELQVELKSLQREVGITFVYVTHDQEEALTMSDRMAVMSGREDRAARDAARRLRGSRHTVRGRVPRRVQPDGGQLRRRGARHGRRDPARRGAGRRCHRRRPHHDPAGARRGRAGRHRAEPDGGARRAARVPRGDHPGPAPAPRGRRAAGAGHERRRAAALRPGDDVTVHLPPEALRVLAGS